VSEPTYNTDLLMQVREKIVTEPERHRQDRWAVAFGDEPPQASACGAAYCVAGWAAVLDGQTLKWEQFGPSRWVADKTTGGEVIWVYAQTALGLTHGEEGRLFAGTNSRDYVLRVLDALIEAGKNGERLAADDPIWQQ
jgi:hypothetical protein